MENVDPTCARGEGEILPGGVACLRIRINGDDPRCPEGRRGDGENPGPRPHVQNHRPPLVLGPSIHERLEGFQAHPGRGVVAGAEGHGWVNPDHTAVLGERAILPRGRDDQVPADGKRFEVLLPVPPPVLDRDLEDLDRSLRTRKSQGSQRSLKALQPLDERPDAQRPGKARPDAHPGRLAGQILRDEAERALGEEEIAQPLLGLAAGDHAHLDVSVAHLAISVRQYQTWKA